MIKFTDAAPIGRVKITSEGYVTAYARAVRSGIQKYRASEIGLVGDHIVNVYRPPEEVFSAESLRSFSHAPVTINHPSVMVDAENWRDLAVGEVSTEAVRDGEFIALPLILKDSAAIKAVKAGKRELSAGYTADIDFEDGIAPDGTKYQAVQRNIHINHLALVDSARAGSEARIGDSTNWGASPVIVEDNVMTIEVKTVVLGDRAVEVVAKDADTVAAILADHATAIADKDTAIGELKAKLADAEAKVLSDEAITALVDAKVDANTKRAAVAAKFGDEAVKDASDAEIAGMFKVIDKAPAQVNDTARKVLSNPKVLEDADDKILAAQRKFLNLEGK